MIWLSALIGVALIVVSVRRIREGRAAYRLMMGAGIVFIGRSVMSLLNADGWIFSAMLVALLVVAVVVPWRTKIGR